MITEKLTKDCTQWSYLKDKRIVKILKLIESLHFTTLSDNIGMLSTYSGIYIYDYPAMHWIHIRTTNPT